MRILINTVMCLCVCVCVAHALHVCVVKPCRLGSYEVSVYLVGDVIVAVK